jgi:hypothetical protein
MALDPLDLKLIKRALTEALEDEGLLGETEMGVRWAGGTMFLEPGDTTTQGKEVPLDTLFKKIVSLRNNLRVLEAKINGLDQLDHVEKVDLQQYITKCYGSLTTFNALFRDKNDQFVGASLKRR